MPTITLEGPKIEESELKRCGGKQLTEAAVKSYRLPAQIIVVVIKENAPDNVSVGGQLICDRKKD